MLLSKKETKQLLRALCEVTDIEQCQPYTMVRVVIPKLPNVLGAHPEAITAAGFSKVVWPDKWSPTIGIRIAKVRAADRIFNGLWDVNFRVTVECAQKWREQVKAARPELHTDEVELLPASVPA